MAKSKTRVKRRSKVTRDLHSPKYRQRVVPRKRKDTGITIEDYWGRPPIGGMVRV